MEACETREASCCGAEPPCALCPLRPENAHCSLEALWAAGLARLRR